MDLGIAGRRAIVIGATGALGGAVCEALAAEKVDLVLFARGREMLEQRRQELQQRYGVSVETSAGDITRHPDIQALVQDVTALGGAQILVLNTPRPPSPMRHFLDENEQGRWDEAYQLQLHGALLVLRSLAPLVAADGWGRIVAITSASVKQPMPRHAISTIFRAGVQAALKHLAMELAERGVTVNAVAPATVLTPTFPGFHDVAQRIQSVPMKRAGKLEELGATVAFLASENAGFITGQVIQLDGGATLSLC